MCKLFADSVECKRNASVCFGHYPGGSDQLYRATPAAMDFIALSLRAENIGFETIIGMIDNLVAEVKVEQETDETMDSATIMLKIGATAAWRHTMAS